ncbi:MAG: D-glycero-alpha-D-manno-heptose-1,7-bisphosphate 7-phosphatase [Candidatus Cyclobacteriaceae bacterium M2_1C_046]
MNKAIFLDRDGVINKDRPNYVYHKEDFIILPGVIDSLEKLKAAGYLLIVITNQSGIAKGIYTHQHVLDLHDHFQQEHDHLIDKFYYAPWHQDYSESLTRKPGTLLFERAIARFKVDAGKSWMIGDRDRDLQPAKQMGMKTILVDSEEFTEHADHLAKDLTEATKKILVPQDL